MTRHARNNTASACYTYHERQRDTEKSGYGTQKSRLSKDSIKDFDACSLSLQPCRNPVITPDGHLYDKMAILEYIQHQKELIKKSMKEYEKQKRKLEKEKDEEQINCKKQKTENFVEMENSLLNKNFLPSTSKDNQDKEKQVASVSNMSDGRENKLSSFWIPSLTPESEKTKIQKPDTNVYCPISGNVLKFKDLIEIKFTPIDKDLSSKSLISKKERYMCPVTHDILSNSIPVAVLKTSGSVVTMECVEKIIKKDMIDPINEERLNDSDIIPLQRGGTGFASTNLLKAQLKKPVMQA